MALQRLAIAAVVLGSVGCGSATGTSTEPDSASGGLVGAEAAWQRLGIEDYLVATTQTGQALGGCTWVTEVHGAEVDSRWSSMVDNDCGEWDVSVPELHREIWVWSAEVEASSGFIDVEWADIGVPASVEFDLDNSEGEELSLAIEFQDLTPVAGEPSVRVALADARARWSEAEILSYRMEVAEDRNYWSSGCKWITVVTDGVVTDSSVDSSSTSQNCLGVGWTVGQLHDQISSWADSLDQFSDPAFGEHTLTVVFDEFGVPEQIAFDLANGSDEEASLRVTFMSSP